MQDNRKVPQNLPAERAVLGGVIMDPALLKTVTGLLEERDFLLPQNQRIFRHLCKMHNEGSFIDLLTLVDRLGNFGELDGAGGSGYISSLIDGLHNKSNVPHYAAIVREKAILRRIAHESEKLTTAALEGDSLTTDLITNANDTFSRLGHFH